MWWRRDRDKPRCAECDRPAVDGERLCAVCLDWMMCNFCRRRREDVTQLYGGYGRYICDRCVRHYANELEDADPIQLAINQLHRELAAGSLDGADLSASLEACFCLARARPGQLLALAQAAVRVSHYEIAMRILDAVGDGERDHTWAWTSAWAQLSAGNIEMARVALERMGSDELSAREDAIWRATDIALRAHQVTESDERRALLTEIDDAEIAVRENGETDLLAYLSVARARCYYGLAELGKAERLLRDASRQVELGSPALILYGDCLHALGRLADAHERWIEVTENEREGNRWHSEAKERLASAATPYR